MIGRTDFFGLRAASLQIAFEGILAACRNRWLDGVFLDGDEEHSIPLNAPELSLRSASREFFVFDKIETEREWDDLGPCEENWNRMLHFLCDEQADSDGPYTRVTVVVDEVTSDIQKLFDDLQAYFNAAEQSHREAV